MDVGRPTPHRADDGGVCAGSEERRGAADPVAVRTELLGVLADAAHEHAREVEDIGGTERLHRAGPTEERGIARLLTRLEWIHPEQVADLGNRVDEFAACADD